MSRVQSHRNHLSRPRAFASQLKAGAMSVIDIEPEKPPPRLASIDSYRGLVMFLMMAEVLRLCAVAAKAPRSRFWAFLCHHQSHVEWIGCSLHDLIQPS